MCDACLIALLSVIQIHEQSITYSKLYGLSRVRKTRIFVRRVRVRHDIYVMISVYVTRFTIKYNPIAYA